MHEEQALTALAIRFRLVTFVWVGQNDETNHFWGSLTQLLPSKRLR